MKYLLRSAKGSEGRIDNKCVIGTVYINASLVNIGAPVEWPCVEYYTY